MDFDVVIRGGTVVDGTGAPAREGDVAVRDGRIVEVGDVDGSASRQLDAEGCVVTPGFVDIHTHLDAQLAWDPVASSSCWHGVTSVVLGNCGVTFAPCKPSDREYLATMMESVEDIPADSILSGLSFDWETYGEYLAAIDRMPKGVNVGGMVGHCAVRFHAMGERSLDDAPAGDDDIAAMQALVDEAIGAGALGFSSSRTFLHRVPDGRPVPGTFARADELLAIADVLRRRGAGVVELAARLGEGDGEELVNTRAEVAWMAQITRDAGRPVTFNLAQTDLRPTLHDDVLAMVDEENAAGAGLRPQTTARGIGILFGLAHRTPFDRSPAWAELRDLPLEEKVRRLDDALIAAGDEVDHPLLDQLYYLDPDNPRYDWSADDSLGAMARAAGETPAACFVRLSRSTNGRALFAWPFLNQRFDAVETLLSHPSSVLGLGDAGAHVGQIMDASLPTFFLSYWVNERKLFSLEDGIRKLTSEPASLFGIGDRGVLRPGAHADVNIIDVDALALEAPEYVHDFPGGAGRYIQRARGYRATLVNGQLFMQDGVHAGALAGTTLRS